MRRISLCLLLLFGFAPAQTALGQTPGGAPPASTKETSATREGQGSKGGTGDSTAAKPPARKKKTSFVIVVMGDSLADGLWASLYRSYVRVRGVKVLRETLNSSGFTAYNWQAKLEGILRKYRSIDIAVVQMGANDRQRLIAGRGNYPRFGTEDWQRIYQERVEKFIKTLTDRKIPVFWAGLPIMRKENVRNAASMMNLIFKDAAKAGKATYISTWEATANEAGEYVDFVRDDKGRRRRFRHHDGIHSSDIGYDRVGDLVISTMRKAIPDLPAPDN